MRKEESVRRCEKMKQTIQGKILRNVAIGGVCFYLLACGWTPQWCQRSFESDVIVPQTIETTEPVNLLPLDEAGAERQGNIYGDYLAGYFSRQNQDYERTIMYLKRILAHDPNNNKIKQELYLLQAFQGNFNQMMPLVHEMAQAKDDSYLAGYVLISDAIKRRDFEHALERLSQKGESGVDSILKPTMKAWIYAAQGKKVQAENALKTLIEKSDEKKSIYLCYAALLNIYLRQPQKADMYLQQLAKDGFPSLMDLVIVRHLYEGSAQWQAGQPVYQTFYKTLEAKPATRDVVLKTKLPDNLTPEFGIAMAFYDLSVALGSSGLVEQALLFNEVSLYLYPELVIPKIWGAEMFESIQAYRAANKMYDRIQNPLDIILFKKARNLMNQEEYQQALLILQDACERQPMNGLGLQLLAETYTALEQWEQALAIYQKLVALLKTVNQPTDLGIVFFEMGAVYDKLGQTQQGEQYLLRALKLLPNHPLVLNYLGYLWLERNKNQEEAFQMVQKAHEANPEDPHIMDSLALGYYRLKQYDKALPLSERSVDLIPYSSVAYGHLGDIYAALGRKAEALYQYERALTLTVDMTPDLKQNLSRKKSLIQTELKNN